MTAGRRCTHGERSEENGAAHASLTVARWGALATIAGGLLFTLEGVVDALSPAASPLAVILSPAVLLLLVGFLGFHALQHRARDAGMG